MYKQEVQDYKTTGATCALDKDEITTKELIQYHEKKIALISDKNKSEKLANCDKKHLTERYNNTNLFQNMLFENIGYSRGETPVIPTRMEETKLPKVSITEVDLDDDDVTDDNEEDEGTTPPSTPCLMREIQSVLDQDVARKMRDLGQELGPER